MNRRLTEAQAVEASGRPMRASLGETSAGRHCESTFDVTDSRQPSY